jgi:hypothetical protein
MATLVTTSNHPPHGESGTQKLTVTAVGHAKVNGWRVITRTTQPR